MLTINELKATYTEYNQKYFDGELPPVDKVTIRYSNRLSTSAGLCCPSERTIEISSHYAKRYGEEETRSVLLHEMIHLQIRGHGEAFMKKMGDIQAKGGNVSRYSKGRAKVNWEYVCNDCGTRYERGRRLKYGGRYHTCGVCNGKLRERRVI